MDSEESNKIIKGLENNIYRATDRIVFIVFGKAAISDYKQCLQWQICFMLESGQLLTNVVNKNRTESLKIQTKKRFKKTKSHLLKRQGI